jgi:hypothetical protein
MGTKLTVTKEDVLATTLLNPGWYPITVMGYSEKAAGTDGSLNRFIEFLIDDGPQQGVKLRAVFNEKFAPLLPDYVTACGAKYEVGVSMDLEETKNLKLMAHVKRGEYNGRPNNEIDGFRPRG